MSENALRLITGVRHQAVVVSGGSPQLTHTRAHRLPQLVVTVTGFQLYKDANEFYFSHECVQNDGGGTDSFAFILLSLNQRNPFAPPTAAAAATAPES
jgi:hypothetical protein